MQLAYLSKTPGIGGAIKKAPEDFVVEEIEEDGKVLPIGEAVKRRGSKGDFTHFVLQKRNWDTMQALRAIAKKLHCSPRRFNYAGTKDRVAVTSQLASGFKIDREQLLILKIKDIQINGAWSGKEKVDIGSNLGNRFRIVVRDTEARGAPARIKKITKELGGVFPNYFGEQRFGIMRGNTHMVGKAIVNGNFKEAVWNYIAYTDGNEPKDAVEARKQLLETGDFRQAFRVFPKYLRYEKTMLNHLAENPNDYVNSLRKLPRGLALMFVHSYQSYIFNRVLSKMVEERRLLSEEGSLICGRDRHGFPSSKIEAVKSRKDADRRIMKRSAFLVGRIIGYESEGLSADETAVMEEEGLSTKNFLIKSLPEISAKGSFRCLLIPLDDFKFKLADGGACFSFSLPSGSYATSVLREFTDKKG